MPRWDLVGRVSLEVFFEYFVEPNIHHMIALANSCSNGVVFLKENVCQVNGIDRKVSIITSCNLCQVDCFPRCVSEVFIVFCHGFLCKCFVCSLLRLVKNTKNIVEFSLFHGRIKNEERVI